LPRGARYTIHLAYRPARAEWGQRMPWTNRSHEPGWYRFAHRATPRQHGHARRGFRWHRDRPGDRRGPVPGGQGRRPGQAYPLTAAAPAADLVRDLWDQARAALIQAVDRYGLPAE
jgi:hypothetical protein